MALLKAIPESLRSELVSQREVGSVSIVFKVLRVNLVAWVKEPPF